jgi:hypothetical protein
MRWYWKDFATLERWARSEPHRIWWQTSCAVPAGPGFGTRRIS